MQINETIFKAYDFRGIYPDQFNEDIMERIGQATIKFLGTKEILVGWDMRLSAPQMSKAFIDGAKKQGAKIISLGQITTDTLYFAAGKYNLPGVMITASHNPKEFIGIKFCKAKAEPVAKETGLDEIKEMVLKNEFTPVDGGSIEEKDGIMEEFREHCYKFVDESAIKPLKVVADAGNGMAGKLVPVIFKDLPCEIVPLYFELDGSFPNHQPSPVEKENNLDLIAKVKEVKADIGLAFDGDADRVFFIDENGEMLDASFVVAMVAKKMLEENPGAKVIYPVAVSKAVPETVEKYGGTSLMTKVGHSYIKQMMREENALFAGEHSGHYYYRDNYLADSGIITALIVIEMMSKSGKPLSELIKEFQLYSRIEETNTIVEDKDLILQKLRDKYGENLTQEFDGVTFEFEDWWFNVRPSNTESLLRLNLEAKTDELKEEKAKEVLDLIRG